MRATVSSKINDAERRVRGSIEQLSQHAVYTTPEQHKREHDAACTAVGETFAAVRVIAERACQLEDALRVLTGYVESCERDGARPLEWAKIARKLIDGEDAPTR